MNANILTTLTIPSNIKIEVAQNSAPSINKVAEKINKSEAIAMVSRAVNAWYYS